MNRSITRFIGFFVTIGYQIGIFWAITKYAQIFASDATIPADKPHSDGSLTNNSPYHMRNIMNFWIVIEISYYGATIICIMIVLAMSSCFKLKKEKPLTIKERREEEQLKLKNELLQDDDDDDGETM